VPPFVIGTVSDNVDPAAVTVMAAVPSKFTPLIARAVCSAVAVPALPVIVVWSPVLLPEIELVPVTARVGVEEPETTTEFIEDGVIAPSVRLIAGVVVDVATEPLTPLAVVTLTEVTLPTPAATQDVVEPFVDRTLPELPD